MLGLDRHTGRSADAGVTVVAAGGKDRRVGDDVASGEAPAPIGSTIVRL